MLFITNLIDYLFSDKKAVLYITFNQDDYYKHIGRLKAASIKYRVATTANFSSVPGNYGDQNNEYKIYVKTGDKTKALEAIHNKK